MDLNASQYITMIKLKRLNRTILTKLDNLIERISWLNAFLKYTVDYDLFILNLLINLFV